MKKRVLWLLCLIVSFVSAGAQTADTFTNPVIKGDLADPSVIRVGDTYYLTATSSEWAPFYPVYKSADLVNWSQVGHVFDTLPDWLVSSFWAPELYFHKNKYYAYYTARRKSDGVSLIGVATSKDPAKGFEDKGVLIEHGKEAIDAFVFEDEGVLYISWKAYGLDNRPIELLCSRLSDDGLKLEGEPFLLLRDDDRIGMEGQCMFKKDGYYYILYAVKGCCGPNSDYAVYAARSKSIKGPYELYPANPILGGGGGVLSAGHGTMTTTPDGRMFYICHAYFKGADFYNGRQPILQELKVNEQGWPYFVSGSFVAAKQPVPFAGTVQQPVRGFGDSFDGKVLKQEWTWNYPVSDVKPVLKKGSLLLKGMPKKGNVDVSALCLRPVAPVYTVETEVLNRNGSLKGVTFYGDDKNLVAWGCQGGQLVLKQLKEGDERVLASVPVPAGNVGVKMVVTEGCRVSFLWRHAGGKWKALNGFDSVDYSYLVRWDRVARPGLIHWGTAADWAEFGFFKMAVPE